MASIEDRSTTRAGGKRWLARWREPNGQERKKSFARKTDAEKFLNTIEYDKQRGAYVDPKAGNQTLDDYADYWIKNRTGNPKTLHQAKGRLRLYVTGTSLGRTPIAKIRPSAIQAWLKSLTTIQEGTASLVYSHVHAILDSAVADELILRNPCDDTRSVKKPRQPRVPVTVSWTADDVTALYNALPERYQPLAILGPRLGLRPSESFGLSVDDIDWSQGSVTVQRQVKIVTGQGRVFDLPKGGKARAVPLPSTARDLLSDYLLRFPAQAVTLPDVNPNGQPEQTVRLLMTNTHGCALHSTSIGNIWRRARKTAGIADERKNGPHMLRHFYATNTLTATGNPASVASYLGHASTAETVNTYTHPAVTDWDATKAASDATFAADSDHAQGTK